jgi:hypothetical protein
VVTSYFHVTDDVITSVYTDDPFTNNYDIEEVLDRHAKTLTVSCQFVGLWEIGNRRMP